MASAHHDATEDTSVGLGARLPFEIDFSILFIVTFVLALLISGILL